MIIAVLLGLIHIDEQSSQIVCIGRCADLVIDHTDCVVCLADIQHGLNEIFTVQTKHPSNTDNKILFQRLADCQFAFQLRLAVHIQRLVILAVRLPRLCSLTIKHIVCADISHLAVQFLADICNVLSATCIDSTDFLHFIVVLCHIHSSPCCTVDHRIRIYFRNDFLNCILVRNIQGNIWCFCYCGAVCHTTVILLNIRAYTLMATLQQFVHHIMTQLTANTCHKKLHVLSSC